MEFSTSVEYAHATMNLPTLKTMKKKSSLQESKERESSNSVFLNIPGKMAGKTGLSSQSRNSYMSGISTECPSGVNLEADDQSCSFYLNTSVSDIQEGDEYILLAHVPKQDQKVEVLSGSISSAEDEQEIESARILVLKPE